MRATFITAPGDIEIRQIPEPTLREQTDAIVRITHSCVCGSDLWSYRGVKEVPKPLQIGHEFIGEVTQVGDDVTTIKVGDFVVAPFTTSDNTCVHCRAGFQSACQNLGFYRGCQAEFTRVANADGTLIAVAEPRPEQVRSLLACSDVLGTGWHAAVSAGVGPGKTAVVVGDGAVGLCAVIAARVLGAERIVAMSRHEPRQQLARTFGATDIVAERGEVGINAILDLTDGLGAQAVMECVGTREAMEQSIAIARPGTCVGFVGVPHGVQMPLEPYFQRNIGLRGGMAPVRAYLPHLIELVLAGTIDPGLVFDLTLPLDEVADAYQAMDERRAIKVMLEP